MSDDLITRVASMIRNSVADLITEPPQDAQTKRTPATREEVLGYLRATLGRVLVEKRAAERDLATLATSAGTHVRKAEIAVEHGREDLARAVLADGESKLALRRELETRVADAAHRAGLIEQVIVSLIREDGDADFEAVGAAKLAELEALIAARSGG